MKLLDYQGCQRNGACAQWFQHRSLPSFIVTILCPTLRGGRDAITTPRTKANDEERLIWRSSCAWSCEQWRTNNNESQTELHTNVLRAGDVLFVVVLFCLWSRDDYESPARLHAHISYGHDDTPKKKIYSQTHLEQCLYAIKILLL